jgi:hypothetical protein
VHEFFIFLPGTASTPSLELLGETSFRRLLRQVLSIEKKSNKPEEI